MFYFKDIRTLKVVTRDHQYNMEVVDGKLIEIDPTPPCLLLAHVPNKKWSYDVNILEKLDAEDGMKRMNPLPQKSDEPKVFYAVVIESDYEEYMRDYAFRELPSKTKELKIEDVIKSDPKPRVINTGDAKTINGATGKTINYTDFNYNPSLDRSNEKAIYRYKSPSDKYGT